MHIGVSVDTGARALLTIGIWPMKFYNLKIKFLIFILWAIFIQKVVSGVLKQQPSA